MNERIKLLAIQADWDDEFREDFDIKKFAELIVKECMSQIEEVRQIKAVEQGFRKHTMITAKEAKALYDDSGAEVEQFLKTEVEPRVTEAAKGGKRSAMIHLGSKGPYEYLRQLVTPQQMAAVARLIELGYSAQIQLYDEKYVPGGPADGSFEAFYGIQIGW